MITELICKIIKLIFRGKFGDALCKFCRKYTELIDYLFWGGCAFVLSMVLYWLFADLMGWNSVFANTVDWIICVLFTYFTNSLFVFQSKAAGFKAKWKEFCQFVAARLFTLVLEDGIILVLDTMLGMNTMVVKLIGQVVVIVTNYILSKLWIFKGKKEEAEAEENCFEQEEAEKTDHA